MKTMVENTEHSKILKRQTDRTWKVKRSELNEMNKEGTSTQGFKD